MRVRLVEESGNAMGTLRVKRAMRMKPTAEHHRQIRMRALKPLKKLETVDAGHHDIAHHDGRPMRCNGEHRQGFGAVCRLKHCIPCAL